MKKFNNKKEKSATLKTAEKYYARACKNFHADEFKSAAADFTESIIRNKKFMNAWVYRADAYFKLEKFDLAVESYIEAARLVSENNQLMPGQGSYYKAKIFCRIAASQLEQGEYQQVIHYSSESSRLMEEYTMTKDFAAPWYLEGMGWLGLCREERALDCFSKAITKCTYDDYYINSLLERSKLLQKLYKCESALDDCNAILQQNPNHVEALIERVRNRNGEALKCSDEDLKDLRKVIELSPENPKAWFMLADCLFGLKRFEEAGDVAAKALEFNVENEKMSKRLRNIMNEARNRKALQEEHMSNYHTFVSSHPCAKIFSHKKDVTIKEKDFDQAILEASKILHINPNDVAARTKRVSAWIGKGEFEKAANDIDKLIDFNQGNDDFLKMMQIIERFRP